VGFGHFFDFLIDGYICLRLIQQAPLFAFSNVFRETSDVFSISIAKGDTLLSLHTRTNLFVELGECISSLQQ